MIIVRYKPIGYYSRRVYTTISRPYYKIGHLGTLDCYAEGKLVIVTDESTKIGSNIDKICKGYIFTIQLGFQTATDDIYGKIFYQDYNKQDIYIILSYLLSLPINIEHKQYTPSISAKRKNGVRDYNRFRNTNEYICSDRAVYTYIKKLRIIDITDQSLTSAVEAEGCFYVRSIPSTIYRLFGIYCTVSWIYRYKYNI